MGTEALAVHAGAAARKRLQAEGWHPDLFSELLGASGGPKWFILSQLDRFLFGEFLSAGTRELNAIGSSVGSWRHACLAQPDPAAAIARFEAGYLYQEYSDKPDAREVSAACQKMLDDLLGTDGAVHVAEHPRIRSHIITARGRGPAGAPGGARLAGALLLSALGNSVDRRLLQRAFQRVVFHSGPAPGAGLAMDDFETTFVQLDAGNVRPALHASGSIPWVLTGERDIPGAPPGHYWDGGIIDYHFDPHRFSGDGLLLFPHFSSSVHPGWFDKFLPWRRASLQLAERLVLVTPHPDLVASLPLGKIPDRGDFGRMAHDERIRYWEQCIDASRAMVDAFAELTAGGDPLRGIEPLETPA